MTAWSKYKKMVLYLKKSHYKLENQSIERIPPTTVLVPHPVEVMLTHRIQCLVAVNYPAKFPIVWSNSWTIDIAGVKEFLTLGPNPV